MNNYNIDKKISQIHLSTTAIIHITEHCVDEYDSYTRCINYILGSLYITASTVLHQ